MSTQSLIPQQSPPPAPPKPEPEQERIAELRQLLLGSERVQAARLRPHLERINPQELGRVLPTAIRARADADPQDQQLADSLMPTIAAALKVAVKRDPQSVADAIFPVMGPAIRQAVWHQFSQLVQQLDKRLQHGFSLQGLKWRFEAWQTKKSFAEIVLYHTLLYRVEHVYLIHRETGLLLQHAARGEVTESDAEIESGMLTAFKTGIQDLAHDIYKNDADVAKSVMRVGEVEFWFAQGPYLVLACVLRGTPAEEFYTDVMAPTIETIQRDYAGEVDNFEGDPAPFATTRPLLETCLRESQRESESAGGFRVSPYLLVPVALVVIALAVWAFFTIRDNRRWRDYLAQLEAEPGIVITETGRRDGRYFVSGLRDPLAEDPKSILDRTSRLAPDEVFGRWQPYQALDPPLFNRRIETLLKPPASIKLTLADGVLTAGGSAPQDWIEQARRIAPMVAGVTGFREVGLIDEEILQIKAKMEGEVPRFIVGTARFAPGQDQQRTQLLNDVQRLFALSTRNGVSVRLEVVGHTDDTGTVEFNDRLSRERAEMVRALFVAAGIDASRLTANGVGSRQPVKADPQAAGAQGAEMNRSVTFHVAVDAGSQSGKQ